MLMILICWAVVLNTIKENTETLLEASKDVCLEMYAEKTKYMIMSHQQNSGHNQNTRIANELFENVAKFKHMGTTLTNQNDIHDEIKSRLNSGTAFHHSVQNFFVFLCHIKKSLYKNLILPVLPYGCETWSHFEGGT
jgi:hypothetical protein